VAAIFIRKLVIIFFLLAFIISPTSATADGNKLLKACNSGLKVINKDKSLSNLEYVDAAFCAGLIQGVTDTNRILKLSGITPFYCVPGDKIDKSQATRIIVKYLRKHPKKLNLPESNLVIDALRKAFPCP
jgi:hypothetical protein